MRMSTILFSACLLWLGVSRLAAQEPDTAQTGSRLSVDDVVITTSVVERQPTDTLTVVAADAGQIYCWTRISGAAGEVEISHAWYHGDKEMARTPLRVAGSPWRTWSSKKIDPTWTGEWRVDVVGPDGGVLRTLSFRVE